MNNLQLKKYAVISVLFMMFAISVSCFTKGLTIEHSEFANISEQVMAGDVKDANEHEEYKEEYEETPVKDEVEENGLIGYLSIPKSQNDEGGLRLEDLYVGRQIRVTVNNSERNFYKDDMIIYYGSDDENQEVIQDVEIKDLKKTDKTEITISLNGVYEYKTEETQESYIVKMYDLQSVYDKIIVVDAGHGGGDNGCGSRDSVCYEKMITLAVVKELKEKLDNTDIKVYYTRLEDKTVYLRPRVTLANDVKADMFISIHCNYYDRYWLYNVNGAETLYSSIRKNIKKNNKKLASIMLDELSDETEISKRTIIDRGSSLYILKKSKVPATIVEMGYMSDRTDLKYLVSEKKREKIVNGLYNGIKTAYKKIYGKTVKETESTK